MPVIVLNLDDNDAIIQLVDSNIQRENILYIQMYSVLQYINGKFTI